MSSRTSLSSILRIRAAAEEEARGNLVRALDRLVAAEEEHAGALRSIAGEEGELARVLEGSPLDLGAVTLRRVGLAALERREGALRKARAALVLEAETRRKALETARAERRAVEELLARRDAERAREQLRAETRETDDVVSTRAAQEEGGSP